MDTQLYCPDEVRKARVRSETTLNAIDYLEVLDADAPADSPRQQTLLVSCLRAVAGLGTGNVRIEGGVRVTPVRVSWAHPANVVPGGVLTAAEQAFVAGLPNPSRTLVVRTDARGDYSTYTLRLVRSPSDADPPAGFDPLLAAVAFSFKVECPSDFDCRRPDPCPPPADPLPPVDYLAKDYASFRRLMLDRLAVLMPAWRDRHPADMVTALVEVLAYAADQVSYHQDAAATEAYLGTARRRVSVRRHARLVDYFVHEGANARAWVCFEVERDALGTVTNPALPPHTPILTRAATSDAPPTLPPARLREALADSPTFFETMHGVPSLLVDRNAIPFHTWGDANCCLPRGATRATLVGDNAALELVAGDVLVFEQLRNPDTGRTEDADPARRHAVRLDRKPLTRTDPLESKTVTEISWYDGDALPFALRVGWRSVGGKSEPIAVARGNVALADHGRTIPGAALPPVPAGRPFRPVLPEVGITQAMRFDPEEAARQPAAAAFDLKLDTVAPVVTLSGDGDEWEPQRDLLGSDRFAPEFVVETEDDGRAYLRFGDGLSHGKRPTAGSTLVPTFRTGGGRAGNVGPGSLARALTTVGEITRVFNPLAASGGTDPEPTAQVKLYAPQAFRTQRRAVTTADYAEAARERHPGVQRAAATRRWTGSWYTTFLTADRLGGRPVDAAFETELRAALEPYRLAGHDLEVDSPRFVPLDVALRVCVAPGYFRGQVKVALVEALGGRGFFHPDRLTFGQTVYLGPLIAAAMDVPGVAWVKPVRFRRYAQGDLGELTDGRLTLGPLEIARLDDDANAPENGQLALLMGGGEG